MNAPPFLRRLSNAAGGACARGGARVVRAWLVMAVLAGGARIATAQGDGFINREYPLKALFLYNFAGYIEWPQHAFASSDEPFVIGILGAAPLDDVLREIGATRTIGNRRIVVKQFSATTAIEPCQILFIARNVGQSEMQQALDRLRGLPVLTVGEASGFAARGGCVNFFIEANKIRFEIHLENARQQQLRLSAKLLALARIVE